MIKSITNCPNCGGILERGGHCPYCGTDINIVHDINISDRTMLEEYVEINLVMRSGKNVSVLPLQGKVSNLTIMADDYALPEVSLKFEGTIREGLKELLGRTDNV